MSVIKVCKPIDAWERRFALVKCLGTRVEVVEGTKQAVSIYAFFEHYWTRVTTSPTRGVYTQMLTNDEYVSLVLDSNARMLQYWQVCMTNELDADYLREDMAEHIASGMSIDEVQRKLFEYTYTEHAVVNLIKDLELRGADVSALRTSDESFVRNAGELIARSRSVGSYFNVLKNCLPVLKNATPDTVISVFK